MYFHTQWLFPWQSTIINYLQPAMCSPYQTWHSCGFHTSSPVWPNEKPEGRAPLVKRSALTGLAAGNDTARFCVPEESSVPTAQPAFSSHPAALQQGASEHHWDTATFSCTSVLHRSKSSVETSGWVKSDHSFKISALLFKQPSLPLCLTKQGKAGMWKREWLLQAFSLQSRSTYRKQANKERENETERGEQTPVPIGCCLQSQAETACRIPNQAVHRRASLTQRSVPLRFICQHYDASIQTVIIFQPPSRQQMQIRGHSKTPWTPKWRSEQHTSIGPPLHHVGLCILKAKTLFFLKKTNQIFPKNTKSSCF